MYGRWLSAYVVGGLEGHYYPSLYGPDGVDVKATIQVVEANRDIVKGIKAHAEIGGYQRWGNTVMKLAAIPTPKEYPHRDIGPVIRQLTDAWGADRMIYGGGFGAEATGASYVQAFEDARAYLTHLSADDQAKIFGGTAVRLFRFKA